METPDALDGEAQQLENQAHHLGNEAIGLKKEGLTTAAKVKSQEAEMSRVNASRKRNLADALRLQTIGVIHTVLFGIGCPSDASLSQHMLGR